MKHWIAYRLHHNGAEEIISHNAKDSPVAVIEAIQRILRGLGRPTGITWRSVGACGPVSAMVASRKLA